MTSTQHVYRANGSETERVLITDEPAAGLERVPSVADLVPVTQIMQRQVRCARRDLELDRLVELVLRHHIGCVPVVEADRPVGIVTKRDLVEQLVVQSERPPARTANDVMMPLAITLGEYATVAHAAALMAVEGVHHIPIVDSSGRLIGIVSSFDVVRWLARNDGYGAL